MTEGPERRKVSRRAFIKVAGAGGALLFAGAAARSGARKEERVPYIPEQAKRVDSAVSLDTFRLETEEAEIVMPGIRVDIKKLGLIGSLNPELNVSVSQNGRRIVDVEITNIHDLTSLRHQGIIMEKARPTEIALPIVDNRHFAEQLRSLDLLVLTPAEGIEGFDEDAVLFVIGSSGDRSLRINEAGEWVVDYGKGYQRKIARVEGFARHIHENQPIELIKDVPKGFEVST